MPDLDLGDVSLHYEVAGDGPLPYVFCHGLGGSGQPFEQDDQAWYAQHFRTVSWDNRGLGRSGAAANYAMPLYAGDLNRLLDHLEIERAVIFGVSWGGVLTQRFALEYPERCLAIVVDSSSSEVNQLASENWYLRGEIARLGEETALSGRANEPAFGGHVTAQAAPARSATVAPEHRDSYIAQTRAIAALREHPMTPFLHRIECPALIVGGGSDSIAGAAGTVIMARAIGDNARLEVFEGAEHGVYREERDAFRQLLLTWLTDNGLLAAATAMQAP